MTFTAIDFETANYNRISACQIGLVMVQDGEIVKEYVSFIKPPKPDYFIQDWTDNIHGITAEMVQDAPSFLELWPEIQEMITGVEALVAHNAPFDMDVLNKLVEHYKIDADLPESQCTFRISQKSLAKGLVNHKLSTVCKHFNIPLNHHEALSDARACAQLYLLHLNS